MVMKHVPGMILQDNAWVPTSPFSLEVTRGNIAQVQMQDWMKSVQMHGDKLAKEGEVSLENLKDPDIVNRNPEQKPEKSSQMASN